MQPTLDGEIADPPPAAPSPREIAFGVARAWLEHRAGRNLPVVCRGRDGALHALRRLIEPALDAGYSEAEVKIAMSSLDIGIPSAAQLEAALTRHRGAVPARPGSRSSGVTRHVAADRTGRDIFALTANAGTPPRSPR